MKDNNRDNSNYIPDYNVGSNTGEYTGSTKLLISKYDFDLFDESKAIPSKIIRIKRSGINKNERWRVLEDENLMFVVEGEKLNKREREFLRTIDGVNFLISQFKSGCNSMTELKILLKKKI